MSGAYQVMTQICLKLKLSHCTPRRRLRGERRYSSYSFSTLAVDGVSGQRHAQAAFCHITHSQDDMSLESDGGMILTGENRRTRRKTCPSVTLSTINTTWIDLDANPGLRDERPATNDLNHGKGPALSLLLIHFVKCSCS
jgi:hypothetical protein